MSSLLTFQVSDVKLNKSLEGFDNGHGSVPDIQNISCAEQSAMQIVYK